MRPKGKLFALLAIFAAIGLVTATGAFTTVTATRTATVNVAGDANALLQLQPHSGPNGVGPSGNPTSSDGYAQLVNGQLEINLNGYASTIGQGPNVNATTDIQGVFNITNAGSQDVDVNISDTGDNDDLVTFYNSSQADLSGTSPPYGGMETDGANGGSAVTLTPGETVVVSIYIDTTDSSFSGGEELIDDITITAIATSP